MPDIGDIFKEFVWDAVVALAVKQLFTLVPFLAWGPIGVVVGWIAGLLADQLYKALKLFVDMNLIPLKNEKHRKAFDDAGVKLKIIAKGSGIDSAEFKGARDAHKKALAEFVKFAA